MMMMMMAAAGISIIKKAAKKHIHAKMQKQRVGLEHSHSQDTSNLFIYYINNHSLLERAGHSKKFKFSVWTEKEKLGEYKHTMQTQSSMVRSSRRKESNKGALLNGWTRKEKPE